MMNIDPADIAEFRRLQKKLDGIRGDGVVNSHDSIVIKQARIRPFYPQSSIARAVTVSGKITGNASGNGKYTGKSFADVTADVSASGNLAESDFGTLAGSNDCLILNPPELGVSNTGHDVTAATNTAQFAIYFTGRLVRINSDGTKVVHAMLFWAGC